MVFLIVFKFWKGVFVFNSSFTVSMIKMCVSLSVTGHRNQHLHNDQSPSGSGKSLSSACRIFLFVFDREQYLRTEEDAISTEERERKVNAAQNFIAAVVVESKTGKTLRSQYNLSLNLIDLTRLATDFGSSFFFLSVSHRWLP